MTTSWESSYGQKIKNLVLVIYGVATLLPTALSLSSPFSQVQLTELVFLAGLPFFRREIWFALKHFPVFAWASLSYAGANLISGYCSGDKLALLEAGGRCYLLLLSLMVAGTISLAGKQKGYDHGVGLHTYLVKSFVLGTVAICVGTLFFYVSGITGHTGLGSVVYLIPDYPYFGTVFRMSGTGSSYGMFAMLVLPGFVFGGVMISKGQLKWWFLLPILGAVLLTLAKENVLYLMGLLLLPVPSNVLTSSVRWVLTGGLTLLLFAVTHYMPLAAENRVEGSEFVSDRIAWQPSPDWFIIETNYTAHKRAGLLIGSNNPWVGVGPGRFQDHTGPLAERGQYPAHLVGFNPHSAWTGAFAETGLFGLLSLFFLTGALIFYLRHSTWNAVCLILVLFLVASVFKDVMNFRGLWWLIGLSLGGVGLNIARVDG